MRSVADARPGPEEFDYGLAFGTFEVILPVVEHGIVFDRFGIVESFEFHLPAALGALHLPLFLLQFGFYHKTHPSGKRIRSITVFAVCNKIKLFQDRPV